MILQGIKLLKAQSSGEFTKTLAFLPTNIGLCTKALNIFNKKSQILALFKLLDEINSCDFWKKRQLRAHVERRIKQMNKLFRTVFCILIISFLLSCLHLVFLDRLVYQMWIPFNYKDNSLVFSSILIYQLVICFVYSPLILFVDMLPFSLLGSAIGLTEELAERLKIILDDGERKKAQPKPGNSKNLETINENVVEVDRHLEELKNCIKFQLKIKEVVTSITDNFGKIFWLQGFISTLILCAVLFSLTTVSNKNPAN
jgi:7tm Odorant receptor